MTEKIDEELLKVILDSWQRHNTIMLNVLSAVPEGGLETRATPTSHTVAEIFTHMHHERLISVFEEAPEYARKVPEQEWVNEHNREHLSQMLRESAQAVHEAVEGRVRSGRHLELNYDHPILLLQLLLWHEAYHHGQIKLALKIAGQPIHDDQAGPLTWDIWRKRRNYELDT